MVRSLRPDRVPCVVTSYINNNLGHDFTDPPVLNMSSVLEDSSCRVPLIFVLSPGVVCVWCVCGGGGVCVCGVCVCVWVGGWLGVGVRVCVCVVCVGGWGCVQYCSTKYPQYSLYPYIHTW